LFAPLSIEERYTVNAFTVETTDAPSFQSQFRVGDAYSAPAGVLCFAQCGTVHPEPECCLAEAGVFVQKDIAACEGDEKLNVTATATGVQSGVEYTQVYLLAEGGKISKVSPVGNFDLRGKTADTPFVCTVYALNIKTGELAKIPGVTGIYDLIGQQIRPLDSLLASAQSDTRLCGELTKGFEIKIYPKPEINKPSDQNVFHGAPTLPVEFAEAPGSTCFWIFDQYIGLASGGSGNIPAFTAVNTGKTPVVSTFTVSPVYTSDTMTCTGPAQTFRITVNPQPVFKVPENQVVCAGAPTDPVVFAGDLPGTVFHWTNNAPGIGLPASGSGDLSAFTAGNGTNAPVTALITVTPVLVQNGNPVNSPPFSFTLTVNPRPELLSPADQKLCAGAVAREVIFTSTVPGTEFRWKNNNPDIGLPENGTGNIPPFVVKSGGPGGHTASVSVTPVYTNAGAGCTGATHTFAYTVTPPPTADAGPDLEVFCPGMSVDLKASGGVSCTWSPADGLSDPSACTPSAKPPAAITYTVTVTDAAGCTASDQVAVRVLVNDLPKAVCKTNVSVNLSGGAATALTAKAFDNGSYDECTEVWFKVRRSDGQSPCLPAGEPTGFFREDAVFCCADATNGRPIPVTLRVYDLNPGSGPAHDSLFKGRYRECTATVQVKMETAAIGCKAPKDVVVACKDFKNEGLDDYGAPSLSMGCDTPQVKAEIQYNNFDFLCHKGEVLRIWTVSDKSGASAACTQTIRVDDGQYYRVRFPLDKQFTVCEDIPGLNYPDFSDVDCEIMNFTHKDDTVLSPPTPVSRSSAIGML
jgi:hypothetical protein